MKKGSFNRGTFRRFYNKIVTCACCGKRTQSQIGSGTDLCRGCYDFAGDYNTFQDGGAFADLPRPTHDCKFCREEYADAQRENDEKFHAQPEQESQMAAGKSGQQLKDNKVKKNKKTVNDLQAAADAATAKINGAAKPAKKVAKKKAKSKDLGGIFGHSVCSVARALGLAGFKPSAAVAAIHAYVPEASVLGIRTFVQAGRHGLRGAPAKLTKKQLKEMGLRAAEAAAFAARPTSTAKA